MKNCPICQKSLLDYIDNSGYIQSVCWNCGHYESDSPAYKTNPEVFENMIRENPKYFLEKFSSPDGKQDKKNPDDYPESKNVSLKYYLYEGVAIKMEKCPLCGEGVSTTHAVDIHIKKMHPQSILAQ